MREENILGNQGGLSSGRGWSPVRVSGGKVFPPQKGQVRSGSVRNMPGVCKASEPGWARLGAMARDTQGLF